MLIGINGGYFPAICRVCLFVIFIFQNANKCFRFCFFTILIQATFNFIDKIVSIPHWAGSRILMLTVFVSKKTLVIFIAAKL